MMWPNCSVYWWLGIHSCSLLKTLFHKWIFKDRFDAFTHRLGFGNAPSITHVPAIGNAHRADTNNTINCNGSHSHCAFIEGWVFLVSNNNKQGGGQNLCHRHPRMMVRIRNNVLLKTPPMSHLSPVSPVPPVSPCLPCLPHSEGEYLLVWGRKDYRLSEKIEEWSPLSLLSPLSPQTHPPASKACFRFALTSVVWKSKMKMHSKSRLFQRGQRNISSQ